MNRRDLLKRTSGSLLLGFLAPALSLATRHAKPAPAIRTATLPEGHFATARSGAWSDPATWLNGAVPANGAKLVTINAGHAIELDQSVSGSRLDIFEPMQIGKECREIKHCDVRSHRGLNGALEIPAGTVHPGLAVTHNVFRHLGPPEPVVAESSGQYNTTRNLYMDLRPHIYGVRA